MKKIIPFFLSVIVGIFLFMAFSKNICFSLLILLLSAGIFYILNDIRKIHGYIISASAFLTAFFLSFLADTSIKKDISDAEFVRIGIIQPFIEQSIKLDEYEFRKRAYVYFPLMDKAIRNRVLPLI